VSIPSPYPKTYTPSPLIEERKYQFARRAFFLNRASDFEEDALDTGIFITDNHGFALTIEEATELLKGIETGHLLISADNINEYNQNLWERMLGKNG
jgi:hypothetical protein